jgi:hypothetical protein
MQIEHNGVRRPTSLTVICVLGIISSALTLLTSPLDLVIGVHWLPFLLVFFLDIVVAIGFLVACILMLNAHRSGRVLYHVFSGVWLLVQFVTLVIILSFGLAQFIQVATPLASSLEGAKHAVFPFLFFYGLNFVICLSVLVIFNIMLFSAKVKSYWRKKSTSKTV